MKIETRCVPTLDEKAALQLACDSLSKIHCDGSHCKDCPFCMVITKTKWDNDIIATQCSIKWIMEVREIWDESG